MPLYSVHSTYHGRSAPEFLCVLKFLLALKCLNFKKCYWEMEKTQGCTGVDLLLDILFLNFIENVNAWNPCNPPVITLYCSAE